MKVQGAVLAFVIGFVFSFAACVPKKPSDFKTDKEVYNYALKLYKDEDYSEAVKFFEEIQRNYALGPYVPDASYYLAMSYFNDDKWLEAADSFGNFVKLYPSNAHLAEARLHLARAYEKQIPGTIDRDQKYTQQALDAYQQYLSYHPRGEEAGQAARKIIELKGQLAQRELYVARFYFRKHNYQAALGRLQELRGRYPEAELGGEDLYYYGASQVKLGEPREARAALEQYLKKYPDGSRRGRVQELLDELSTAGREESRE